MSVITLVIFIVLLMYHLNSKVDSLYNDTTKTMSFIQKTLAKNSREVVRELKECPERDYDNYMILEEEGILLGRVRNCMFFGTRFSEAVGFTASVNGMDWFIMYSRDLLERYTNNDREFLDRFLKGKRGDEDYIVEGSFSLRLVRIAKRMAGYKVIDTYRTMLIDYPILLKGDLSIGKVVFVKDFTPVLLETILTPAVFIFYSISLVAILSTILLLLFNRIVKEILFLREATAKFKEKDFSEIQEINEMVKKTRSRDELFYLKRSILDMAQELEATLNQLKSERDQFEEMAYTDPLTGLANRRFFMKEAEQFFQYARRYNEPITLIMLDIDDFKLINDTHGHDVGDKVLKNLAQVIRNNIRKSDIAARYGGEEFIILLPSTDENGALLVAERIRQDFKNTSVSINGESVSTTVSVGIATMGESNEFEELIKKADSALYEAKKQGKDKVVVFKDEREELQEQGSPVPESQNFQ